MERLLFKQCGNFQSTSNHGHAREDRELDAMTQGGAKEDVFRSFMYPAAFQRKSTPARWPAQCIQYPLWTHRRKRNCLATAE